MREKTQFNFALRWQQSDPEARRKRQLRQRMTWGIAGVVVILFCVMAPLAWIFELQLQQNNLQKNILALNSINALSQKANLLVAEVDNQKKVLEVAKVSSHDPQALLEQLSKFLPQGAIISSFSLKEDVVNMKIGLPTPIDVARLWTSLKDSHLFTDVDLQTLSLADKPQTLNLNLKLAQQNPSHAPSGTVQQGNVIKQNATLAPNGASPTSGGKAP